MTGLMKPRPSDEADVCPRCGGTGYPKPPPWLAQLLDNPGLSWSVGGRNPCMTCKGSGWITPEQIELALQGPAAWPEIEDDD